MNESVAGGGGASPDAGALARPPRASAGLHQGEGGTSQEAGQQGGCQRPGKKSGRRGKGYM